MGLNDSIKKQTKEISIKNKIYYLDNCFLFGQCDGSIHYPLIFFFLILTCVSLSTDGYDTFSIYIVKIINLYVIDLCQLQCNKVTIIIILCKQ